MINSFDCKNKLAVQHVEQAREVLNKNFFVNRSEGPKPP